MRCTPVRLLRVTATAALALVCSMARADQEAQQLEGCQCDVERCNSEGITFTAAGLLGLLVTCGPAAPACWFGTTMAAAASFSSMCTELAGECVDVCFCDQRCPATKYVPQDVDTTTRLGGLPKFDEVPVPEAEQEQCFAECKEEKGIELECHEDLELLKYERDGVPEQVRGADPR